MDLLIEDQDLYVQRKLSEGFPALPELAHKTFSGTVSSRPDDGPRIEKLVLYLNRLVDLSNKTNLLVLGCGPHPRTAQLLSRKGYNITAVEPVPSFVQTASDFLGEEGKVLLGAAENIPVETGSQDIVVFEAVLEHVDSIPLSLSELFRVLRPGGIVYLTTTNRHKFSLTGKNGEFTVPFYNWFPKLVKEGYVYRHLHHQPQLANYTTRPAVHWLSYTDLCRMGRDAGFAQFYSPADLMRISDPIIARSSFRRAVLPLIQRSPWLRALALTQLSNSIFMLKRR